MALIQAARVQTLHLITVSNYQKLKTEFVFQLDGCLKQSRPGFNSSVIVFQSYPPDRRLCISTVLKEYLNRTRKVRGKNANEKLLLSYIKPYKPVCRDTTSRWIRTVMCRSKIDITKYSSHSVRSASVSKATYNAAPIKDVLEKAGWSNVGTFAKFYHKKIDNKEDKYQSAVLQ